MARTGKGWGDGNREGVAGTGKGKRMFEAEESHTSTAYNSVSNLKLKI